MIHTIPPPIIEQVPNAFSFSMIKVAGGSFMMGDNQSPDKRQKPEHLVTVPTFYMAQYTVTNAQYAVFLNEYGSSTVKTGEYAGEEMVNEYRWGVQKEENAWRPALGYEQHPIVEVSWYGAVTYCQWLSEKTGQKYRLPSEAEWEYAARGGKHSLGFPYAGSHRLAEVAWYDENSYGETHPVGLKAPNELGLHDMSGNVREWCADHWHRNYNNAPKDGSAWIKGGDTSRRVLRGGSWVYYTRDCRSSYRYLNYPNDRYSNYGFRLVRA